MAGALGDYPCLCPAAQGRKPLRGRQEKKRYLTPPPGACIRKFEIAAIQMNLEYNRNDFLHSSLAALQKIGLPGFYRQFNTGILHRAVFQRCTEDICTVFGYGCAHRTEG